MNTQKCWMFTSVCLQYKINYGIVGFIDLAEWHILHIHIKYLYHGLLCTAILIRLIHGHALKNIGLLRNDMNQHTLLFLTLPRHESNTRKPSKHNTLNQCWINVGSTSRTLTQHWVNVSCLLGYVLILSKPNLQRESSSATSREQMWVIFSHFQSWVAVARHNFKWLEIIII